MAGALPVGSDEPMNPKGRNMKTVVVQDRPAAISANTELLLSEAQLASRRHLVDVLGKPGKGGTRVRTREVVQFKIGESFGIAGEVPKHLLQADLAGDEAKADRLAAKASKPAIDKARAEGHAAGRAEMLAEVTARNAVFDAADAAAEAVTAAQARLDAATDDASRQDLQQALVAAQAALDAAEAAVDALPELKA